MILNILLCIYFFVIPGYVIINALFPALSFFEKILIGSCLTIATIPLIAFALAMAFKTTISVPLLTAIATVILCIVFLIKKVLRKS